MLIENRIALDDEPSARLEEISLSQTYESLPHLSQECHTAAYHPTPANLFNASLAPRGTRDV